MGLIAAPGACTRCARFPLPIPGVGTVCMCGTPTLPEPEVDMPTLSYTVTRTITLTVDITPDDAKDARDRGVSLAEQAADMADAYPLTLWNVADEDVTPA